MLATCLFAGHALHLSTGLVLSALKRPAGQLLHAPLAPLENCPAGHDQRGWHDPWPGLGYWRGHGTQDVSLVAPGERLQVPDGHAWHSVTAPLAELNRARRKPACTCPGRGATPTQPGHAEPGLRKPRTCPLQKHHALGILLMKAFFRNGYRTLTA